MDYPEDCTYPDCACDCCFEQRWSDHLKREREGVTHATVTL
jgi:hypothetical protein